MSQLAKMIECYEHFKSSPFDELIFNEDGESIESLCETDWTRILLIRTSDQPGLISVEVEVSLPKCITRHDAKSVKTHPRDSLKSMIKHLEYLLELEGFGFKLDLVGEDCLWTASKKSTDTLDVKIFEALIPP